MTRSEQIEAAARALVDAKTNGQLNDLINQLRGELARPADAEPVAWIAHDLFGRPVDFMLGSAHPVRDAAPDATTVEYAGGWHPTYASPPSPDRTQGHSVAGVDILRDTLSFVLEYPDFDPPHPYRTMIEQALAGQVPDLLMDAAYLRRGVKPPKRPAHVAAQADALAALKELCDVQSAPYQELGGAEFNVYIQRLATAWAEARRVIAATGEKHE